MTQPQPRQSPLPVRVAMKSAVIASLVAIIALGGVLTAFAATRTVETSATLEMEFWVSLASRSVFVSTRQEGYEWITHDFLVPLNEYPGVKTLLVSDLVSVPVTLEVEVEDPALTPLPAATPHLPPGEAPSGRATCCTVRGMWDASPAQRAITTQMRRVISYARTNLGLTHEGPITINIAHNVGGLNVRYEEAFGEALDELPSDLLVPAGGTHLLRARLPVGRDGDREGVVHPRGAVALRERALGRGGHVRVLLDLVPAGRASHRAG